MKGLCLIGYIMKNYIYCMFLCAISLKYKLQNCLHKLSYMSLGRPWFPWIKAIKSTIQLFLVCQQNKMICFFCYLNKFITTSTTIININQKKKNEISLKLKLNNKRKVTISTTFNYVLKYFSFFYFISIFHKNIQKCLLE